MEFGLKWWSCAPKKFKKPRKKTLGGRENPRSTWVARTTHSPSFGCGCHSFPGSLAAPWGIKPLLAISVRSFSVMVDRIQSPWTQPFGRRDLDEDPPRLVVLPFAFPIADAFFARSSAAVFSFTMATGEVTRSSCAEAGAGAVGGGREGRERMERYCSKTLAGRFYKITSVWMIGGPGRSNHIPK